MHFEHLLQNHAIQTIYSILNFRKPISSNFKFFLHSSEIVWLIYLLFNLDLYQALMLQNPLSDYDQLLFYL